MLYFSSVHPHLLSLSLGQEGGLKYSLLKFSSVHPHLLSLSLSLSLGQERG